jgi:hypothetical protein
MYKNNIKSYHLISTMNFTTKQVHMDNYSMNFTETNSCFNGNSDLTDILPTFRMIEGHDLFYMKDDEEPHFYLNEDSEESLMNLVKNISQKTTKSNTLRLKKGKKNSNAIKKMGRIIVNNTNRYKLLDGTNPGIAKMFEKLE